MKIPFHKPHITEQEIKSVIQTIESGWLTMGPKTLEFENNFRNYIGSKYAISVNSATAALHLSLSACGIKKNDEVIIPTNTFISTAEVVAYFGAKPVLCDIEYDTHNINPSEIEKLISPRTKAIIPVHFGGNPCKINTINKIARKYNLKVIEDAAHALPSLSNKKRIGTISDVTCFSFYATKTLTTGEGGMVSTNNKKIANKIKIQRLHGINGDAWNRYNKKNEWYYEVVDIGYKYNTTDIQSALGIIQLKKIEWMDSERKRIAEIYLQYFTDKIPCIIEQKGDKSSWHLFVIKVSNRDELYRKLKEVNINTSVHFIPIHMQPYYRKFFSYDNDDYPIANKIYKECLSLPIYPGMKKEQIIYVVNQVLKFAEVK